MALIGRKLYKQKVKEALDIDDKNDEEETSIADQRLDINIEMSPRSEENPKFSKRRFKNQSLDKSFSSDQSLKL